MATTSFVSAPTNATLAQFKAWAQGLSDALTTVGVVRSADTGQITWASVVAVPGVSAYAGYEIRVLSTPAGHPLYIKIEYGTGTSAAFPALRIQIGTGTDGAGGLTGNLSNQFVLALTGSSSSTSTSYVSGSTSRVSFVVFGEGSGSNFAMALCVGRTKNDAGVDTDDGANIVIQNLTALKQQYLPKPANGVAYPATAMASVQCAFPPEGNASYGINLGVFPIVPNVGYAGNPTMEAAVYARADQPVATQLDVLMYGATHHFLTTRGTSAGVTVNGNAGAQLAILWE